MRSISNVEAREANQAVAELDDASARIQVQGERYPAAMQAMIDR